MKCFKALALIHYTISDMGLLFLGTNEYATASSSTSFFLFLASSSKGCICLALHFFLISQTAPSLHSALLNGQSVNPLPIFKNWNALHAKPWVRKENIYLTCIGFDRKDRQRWRIKEKSLVLLIHMNFLLAFLNSGLMVSDLSPYKRSF